MFSSPDQFACDMEHMIEIDGSYGEGGGQILRTALCLSCLFQKPFRIFNIRKFREKPGLLPQHLTCVRAAQRITGAEVKGCFRESAELTFFPGKVQAGSFSFDIGTAGSTSLVLQTIIPALVFSGQKSTITLSGGTHVPFSPSFHYLSEVFAHFLEHMGIHVRLSIDSYGFYPRGGGKIRAVISPVERLVPLQLTRRGELIGFSGHSGVGNLPFSIAERQRNSFVQRISAGIADLGRPPDVELLQVTTPGKGTFIDSVARYEHSIAGFTGLGAMGKKAESVGEETAGEFLKYHRTGAALDHHMSDQIVLYLSLCSGESSFTTSVITDHLITNIWAIGLFHDVRYSLKAAPQKSKQTKGESDERRQNLAGKL
jgi:RNA 3'-terminal phosphate cyclase (ATP)